MWTIEGIIAVLNENWEKIVKFFDELWAFAKETILKPDGFWEDETVGE